ncbi:MAG: YaaR family protein [Treponemataceae bacterium]|nr:YaaR family protein [Treponemataceae bacterium]
MSSLDPLGTSLYFSATAQARKKENEAKKATTKKRIFADFLKDASESEEEKLRNAGFPPEIIGLSYEKAVETLLDSVYSTGNDLRKNQTNEDIQKYKRAVKNFINYVVKTCFEVEKHESNRSVLKRKKFFQIQVIDQKLEKLATEVLINQRDQLAFLAKIDEINGLLIDLIT